MLLHLAWRRNLDSLDLALAVNRLASRGATLWWLGYAGATYEPGDYLCEVTDDAAARLADFGTVATPWTEPLPDAAIPIAYPRLALLAGAAAAYPEFAYYAMALARLGFDFTLVDGKAIAEGALQRCDLIVLPSGSTMWGVDAAEGISGADAELRAFLARGGAAIGSGGGAFYLASGRPGWLGAAPVRPIYTQEYLRTGVGIVSVLLGADSIGFGCPPTLEAPFFHGPVFAELDRSVSAAARFDRLVMPGHLFIDNPLDEARFARDVAGHCAILRTESRRGRAVLFSLNPEMGDLIRKYIAFEFYISRYLSIVGEATMVDTLRHYRALESPSWRMILNAIHSLMLRRAPPGVPAAAPVPPQPPAPPMSLAAALDAALVRVPNAENPAFAALVRMLRDDLRLRLMTMQSRRAALEAAFAALNPPAPGIRFLWSECETAAVAALNPPAPDEKPRRFPEELAAIETALALAEAWCRLAEAERHFGRFE